MSRSKRLFALLTILIFIGQLFTAPPVKSAPAEGFPLQQVDKDKIDAYIQSSITISLFAPDVFLVIVTITALSLGWAVARIFLTLHPRRLMTDASS